MGLDLVELVMAIEGSFGIEIPDADACRLETPGLLIAYLADRISIESSTRARCLTQRAFYRSRAAIARRFNVKRRSMLPSSRLRDLLADRKDEWKDLGRDIGSAAWPRLKSDNVIFSGRGGVSTLGELAENLAMYDVASVKEPGTRLSRAELEAVIHSLIESELGVKRSQYTLDSKFTRDMGCG